MAEIKEELKSLLMKVKKESEKVGLKLNIQKNKIMASSPSTSWQIYGETMETVTEFIFLGSKITEDGDFSHEIKRRLLLRKKVMTNLDSILKSRDITNKGSYSKSYSFSSSHTWMWVLDYKESWAPKNWCFLRLEKILESPLDCREIQPVHPKENLSWIFIRTDAEAPILWPPDVKNRFIGKDPDAGKDWRHKDKGAAEDEMLDSITDSLVMNLSKLREIVKDREAWCATVHGVTKSWTWLSNWTRRIDSTLLCKTQERWQEERWKKV